MATRRKPSEYNLAKLQVDEDLLGRSTVTGKYHFTAPRQMKIAYVIAHHMTIVGDGSGKALDACKRVWNSRQASAQYGVEENLIRQFVWDSNAAWATGNRSGNHAGISIEHANTSREPHWRVSETTWKRGAELAAYLHVAYKLGRPTSLDNGRRGTLRKHSSFTSTACPGPFFDSIWGDYVKEAQRVYDRITSGTAPVTPPTPRPVAEYTVRKGDTLAAIARAHGVTVAQLAEWNALADPNKISIGQALIVKDPKTTPTIPQPPLAFWGLGWNIYARAYGNKPAPGRTGNWNWDGGRSKRVGDVLKGSSASLFGFCEINDNIMGRTIDSALGTKTIKWVPSPIGNNDVFHTAAKYEIVSSREVPLGKGKQNRHATHIEYRRDGVLFHYVNTHLSSGRVEDREADGRALAAYVSKLKGPVIVWGDFNNAKAYDGSPRQLLEKAGFKSARQQVTVKYGNEAEHVDFGQPAKPGHWISDVYTRGCRITHAELLRIPKNTSDHRPIKYRVEIDR